MIRHAYATKIKSQIWIERSDEEERGLIIEAITAVAIGNSQPISVANKRRNKGRTRTTRAYQRLHLIISCLSRALECTSLLKVQ
eukprot:scaffold33114_cov55-Attheya_sp.AAC.4